MENVSPIWSASRGAVSSGGNVPSRSLSRDHVFGAIPVMNRVGGVCSDLEHRPLGWAAARGRGMPLPTLADTVSLANDTDCATALLQYGGRRLMPVFTPRRTLCEWTLIPRSSPTLFTHPCAADWGRPAQSVTVMRHASAWGTQTPIAGRGAGVGNGGPSHSSSGIRVAGGALPRHYLRSTHPALLM